MHNALGRVAGVAVIRCRDPQRGVLVGHSHVLSNLTSALGSGRAVTLSSLPELWTTGAVTAPQFVELWRRTDELRPLSWRSRSLHLILPPSRAVNYSLSSPECRVRLRSVVCDVE